MATITWLDKIDGLDLSNPRKNVNADDMNQIKNAVNDNDTNTTASLAALQAEIDAHEALTNNPHSVTKAQVGLSAADNTSDADKPVSTAQQTALDLKANINNPTFTTGIITPSIQITGGTPGAQKVLTSDTDGHGTWVATDAAPTNGSTNLVRSDGVYDSINGVISDIALKAPLASPTFTGTVSGITKTMVGLGNVDNTSDATKLAAVLDMFVWGEVPSGTVDGVNDDFTIANSNPSKVALYLDGIRTNPSNFSITGTALTITNAEVIPTNSILIDYIK